MKKDLIILTTGGSGGHIFPAEAVASCLKKKDVCDIAFVTDKRGQKRVNGTLASVPVYYVSASSVTGKGLLGK